MKQKEDSDIKDIFKRIRKRDFSGYTGLAIKNSVYQFSTSLAAKFGSLIFTIIIARLLMPELFGLYSLALSTIMIFAAFSDLGIGPALVKYVASSKNPGAYVYFLRKLKIFISSSVGIILIATAYFIANYYYNKPIFFALLAGGLYIFFTGFLSFIVSLFQAENNFKTPFYKEIFFQILRLIVVPLAILYFIAFSQEILIGTIILSISICYLFSIFFLYVSLKKYKKDQLNAEEKKKAIKFMLPLTTLVLSGALFGTIDIIMLGRFVASEFIGYYQAAFMLMNSVGALIAFSVVLFPIFSRLKGNRLKKAVKKSRNITIIISLGAFVATLIFSNLAINIVYGSQYSPAVLILRLISLILFIDPLIAIYSNYFISQGKNTTVAKLVLIATLINIVLNYILITLLVPFSMYAASLGAASATILSRGFYLFLLLIRK